MQTLVNDFSWFQTSFMVQIVICYFLETNKPLSNQFLTQSLLATIAI